MTFQAELCPHCESAATIVRERRSVPLGQRRVDIDDEFSRCPKCGEEFYTTAQADQRHRRAIESARLADNLLSPDQVRAVRDALGLSQRQFEQLLGVGAKTCVRWEQGRVCQNVATDRLIRLVAAERENARRLAAINGVALPDSCFVPEKDSVAPMYAAYAAWQQKAPFINLRARIQIGGGVEGSPLDTREHEAITAGVAALKQVTTFEDDELQTVQQAIRRGGSQ
jgi:putative zinc finger/helix-turn-helix YgiT family protein